MEFSCTITKKNQKKLMMEERQHKKYLSMFIVTIIYIAIFFKFIIYNFLLMSIIYLLFMTLMNIAFYIVNSIFINITLKVMERKKLIDYGKINYKFTKKHFIEKSENKEYKMDIKEICNIKIKKNKFYLISNERKIKFTFKKDLFDKKEEFEKAKNYILSLKEDINDTTY